MQHLSMTLETVEENLALDEALLETAEASDPSDAHETEVLRLWESTEYAVILGRSSRVDNEVDRVACDRASVPIRRRCSGGTTVVIGPGCLMYAVLISLELRPECRQIDNAHRLVMDKMQSMLSPLCPEVRHRGTCDLTVGDRKFSGNSLRCKRRHILYHGTLLYDFDIELIARLLKQPPRQPEYREERDHRAFLTNLNCQAKQLRNGLLKSWEASAPVASWPEILTRELAQSRYQDDKWNFRH